MPSAKPNNDREGTKKNQGRQNAFSGVKLQWLDERKDEFMDTTTPGPFYIRTAQLFIDTFGVDLDIEKNPPEGTDLTTLAPKEIDPDLPFEQHRAETQRRAAFFGKLHKKLGNWYRHRFRTRNATQVVINKLINGMIASGSCRPPRKRSARDVYYELCWETSIKAKFDVYWETVKDTTSESQKLNCRNTFTEQLYDKESKTVKDKVTAMIDQHHKSDIEVWKKKAEVAKTATGYHEAWNLGAGVLPGLADILAEWLGACVVITAVCPKDGEIIMQSGQSNVNTGEIDKLMAEYNPNRWSAYQKMVVQYGTAYFSKEECVVRDLRGKGDSLGGESVRQMPAPQQAQHHSHDPIPVQQSNPASAEPPQAMTGAAQQEHHHLPSDQRADQSTLVQPQQQLSQHSPSPVHQTQTHPPNPTPIYQPQTGLLTELNGPLPVSLLGGEYQQTGWQLQAQTNLDNLANLSTYQSLHLGFDSSSNTFNQLYSFPTPDQSLSTYQSTPSAATFAFPNTMPTDSTGQFAMAAQSTSSSNTTPNTPLYAGPQTTPSNLANALTPSSHLPHQNPRTLSNFNFAAAPTLPNNPFIPLPQHPDASSALASTALPPNPPVTVASTPPSEPAKSVVPSKRARKRSAKALALDENKNPQPSKKARRPRPKGKENDVPSEIQATA